MAETENTPVENMVEGVRKSIIQQRLNNYRRQVYGLTDEQKNELQTKIETTQRIIDRLTAEFDEDPGNTDLRENLERNERNLQEMRNELANSGPTVEPNTEEYYRMADVIPELEDILAHADPALEYIPIEEIQRRLAEQRRLRDELVAAQRDPVPPISEEERREIEIKIAEYEAEYERLTRLIENPEVDRDALLAEKTELERRIAEINERLSQGSQEGRNPLSDEDRADLEERLAAARLALNANRDTLAAKNTELDNARRQRDAEIARINSETRQVGESLFSGIDDTHDAQAELNRIANELGIDPSELMIDWHDGATDYGDNVATEFDIVRVERVNEPILTTDERTALENELTEAEAELARLNQESRNPNDMSIDAIIADLDRQIRELTDQIVANNETPQRDDNRVAANEPLLARRAALENQRRALNELRTNSVADLDRQIRELTDQIVAINETPQRDDNRVEAITPLLEQRRALEEQRNAIRNATVADRLADLDAQIRALTDQIVAINETPQRDDNRVEAITPLLEQRRALEEQRNAIRNAVNGLDLDGNAARKAELQNRIDELRARLELDNQRRANHPRLQQLEAQIAGLEGEIRDIEAEIQRLEGVVADLENQVREDDQLRRENEAALTDEERAALEDELRQAREDLRKNGEKRNDPNIDYAIFRSENSRLTQLIHDLEGRLALDTARRARQGNGISDEERVALEQERDEKQRRLNQVNEALENPDKAKEYWEIERQRIHVLLVELREKIKPGQETPGREGVDNSEQIRIAENKIKELEELEKLKEQFKEKPKGEPIPIPEPPKPVIELDEDRIKDEYQRRKHDMYAKYYGDKDYQKEYDERAARYREHEVEVVDPETGKTFRTIEDYEGREDDEKFLLLDNYKDSLERMTKDQAGIEVYHGTPEQIEAQRAKDKEYVETRNHTFDQHKYTQRDLATMGKYGEKMPYIPKQDGVLKNIGRGLLNVGIFARNVVAPLYRVVGKYVAQPIHRLVTGGKDASPYRNNFYHRMVARREYFAEQGRARDAAETQERIQEAIDNGQNPEDVKPVRHPVRNWVAARWNAIFKSKDGNRAVLNAGEHDIQQNIVEQEMAAARVRALEKHREDLIRQAEELQAELDRNPNAPNAEAVRKAVEDRRLAADRTTESIAIAKGEKVETKQTDAVSDKTHAIARKEINTLRTTVIKGVAKGIAAKYIGPAIEKWILEHSKVKTQEWVPETTKQEWVDETTKQEWIEGTTRREWVDETVIDETVPVYGDALPQGKTVRELVAENAGKEYTGWYSVSGGHRRPSGYTLSGDEKITGWWVDDGSKWGTGVSDAAGLTAPTLTDRLVDAGLMTPGGIFRQDVEPAEILRICQMEGIDPSSIYVSVGDNHWAKAAELFGLDKVQIGEEVVSKVIPGHWDTVDVPGFWDTVTVPGHWDTVTVPGYWQEVIKTNPAVAHLLQGGKVVATGAMVADTVQNVAENLRNTHTDVPEHKPQPRHFDRDPDAAALFGDEEHPESKREYEEARRARRTREDDDDEHDDR